MFGKSAPLVSPVASFWRCTASESELAELAALAAGETADCGEVVARLLAGSACRCTLGGVASGAGVVLSAAVGAMSGDGDLAMVTSAEEAAVRSGERCRVSG